MNNAHTPPDRLLEEALDAAGPVEFSRALKNLGPIGGDQIDRLERLTAEGSVDRRANATRLLAIAHDPARRVEALTRVARGSDEIQVWAVAIDALFRDAPDSATAVAMARPDLATRALGGNGSVLAAGIRAATAAGLPGVGDVIARRIDDPDGSVRRAVADALTATDVTPYADALRRRLADERQPDVAARYVAALARSGDPAVHRAVMDYFWAASPDIRNAIADGFRTEMLPWVRDSFVSTAREGGEHRARALAALAEVGGEEMLPLCVQLYEGAPKRGQPGYVEAVLEQAPCNRIISRLAGRTLEGDAALAFARERLGKT